MPIVNEELPIGEQLTPEPVTPLLDEQIVHLREVLTDEEVKSLCTSLDLAIHELLLQSLELQGKIGSVEDYIQNCFKPIELFTDGSSASIWSTEELIKKDLRELTSRPLQDLILSSHWPSELASGDLSWVHKSEKILFKHDREFLNILKILARHMPPDVAFLRKVYRLAIQDIHGYKEAKQKQARLISLQEALEIVKNSLPKADCDSLSQEPYILAEGLAMVTWILEHIINLEAEFDPLLYEDVVTGKMLNPNVIIGKIAAIRKKI